MTRFPILVLTVLLYGTLLNGQSGNKSTNNCPAGVQRGELEAELRQTSSAVVDAIKSGDPDKLMPYLSPRGVVLGVDDPRVSLAAIRKEMSDKTGIYCLLFDSGCLVTEAKKGRYKAKKPSLDDILSYRDYLQKNTPALRVGLWQSSSCGGSTTSKDGYLDLEFERASGGWKVTVIPYL
jgi:hypothetical protein